MKKTLIALAAVAVSGAAFAQSSVVLSGGLSMGLKQLGNVNTIAGVDNVNSNSIIATVNEDLGGGMKATGVLQLRINGANGTNQLGITNGGDMYVQLSGGFGAVRLGQFTFNTHSGFNPFASRAATGSGTTAQSFTGANTVMYTSPNFSGFTVSGAINLDTSAGSVGNNGTGLKANYSSGPLSVQAATTTQTRTTAGAAKTTTNALAARYNFGVAIADANWYSTKTGAVKTAKGYMLGASVPVNAFTFRVAMHRNSISLAATTVDRNAVGVDYDLSKRTKLIAEFSRDKQAVTGLNKQTNHFIGVAHTF